MSEPVKALLLAAGLGSRLRPLTLAMPKPLLPLWNAPLIEHQLRLLESWGVTDVAVNLHWRAEALKRYLDERRGRARVRLSHEPRLLGTGGALRPLREFFGDDPFWVMNADIVAGLDREPLIRAFGRGAGLGAAWLEPIKGPRTVEADRCGRITCFRSPTPGVPGTYTFCGAQVLSPRIFAFCPDRPVFSLVELYEAALAQGVCLEGVVAPGSYWDDAGTPQALLRIHGQVKRRARAGQSGGHVYDPQADRCSHDDRVFFCVSPDARLGENVTGRDSVVAGASRVTANARLRRVVATGGCFGGRLTDQTLVGISQTGDSALLAACDAMKWPAEETSAALLGARGSDRLFWRLQSGARRAVVIRYGRTRSENARYAGHARLLAAADLPVPAVLADLPELDTLALEDWGDDSLQRRMTARPERAACWYRPVLEALARWHHQGARAAVAAGWALEPAFSPDLYAWERDLFVEHLLASRYGIHGLPEGVAREWNQVAERLAGSPQVLLHRDCQSSNILFRGRRFVFIDFQGMRMGPAAYDLASLLHDPYVKLDACVRDRLAAHYADGFPGAVEAVEALHYGAVQRLTQALGAYGRLSGSGQGEFVRHILPGLERLLDAADLCGLDAVGGLAEELIAREQSRQQAEAPESAGVAAGQKRDAT